MPDLLKPEVNAEETEKRLRELLNEFLKSYFSGEEIVLDSGQKRTFPQVEIMFATAAPTRSDVPQIHLVVLDKRVRRELVETGPLLVMNVLLNVFVRVINAGGPGNVADHQCATVADALAWLLSTPAERAALSRKGIHHARVERGPVVQAFPGYQVRFLSVRCELRVEV